MVHAMSTVPSPTSISRNKRRRHMNPAISNYFPQHHHKKDKISHCLLQLQIIVIKLSPKVSLQLWIPCKKILNLASFSVPLINIRNKKDEI